MSSSDVPGGSPDVPSGINGGPSVASSSVREVVYRSAEGQGQIIREIPTPEDFGEFSTERRTEHLLGCPEVSQYEAPRADCGYTAAFFWLGRMNAARLGFPRDLSKALELFQRAASAGRTKAACNAGLHLMHGTGVAKDNEKGRELLNRLADGGERTAFDVQVAQ